MLRSKQRVTFVVPYYQNLKHLKLALESLIAQTRTDWAAIIVDDRGGEDAGELVRSFQDQRFEYHRNYSNLGLARNWNKGIALARSEFVCIFHADDLLMPNYVQVIEQLMDKYPDATAVHCRAKIIGESGNRQFSFPDVVKKLIHPRFKGDVKTFGESGLQSLVGGSWIFCPTLCFRKSKLKSFEFQSRWKFVVDLDFICQVLLDGGLLVGSRYIAYQYRRHGASQTSILTNSLKRFEEEIHFLHELGQKLSEVNWEKCFRKTRRMTILRLHLGFHFINFILKRNFAMAVTALQMAVCGQRVIK